MNKFTLSLAAILTTSTLGLSVPWGTAPVEGLDTVPVVEAVVEETAADALPVFAGFEEDWHQANDPMIVRVVEAFNAEKGWGVGHPDRLEPAVVKAWALQESGGHRDIFTGGDMMQMNNGGDWAPEKVHVGVQKGQRLTPEESLVAGLKWAYMKGEETRPVARADGEGWTPAVREGREISGYVSRFTDWDRAITRYNGGGVADYLGDINRRMARVV